MAWWSPERDEELLLLRAQKLSAAEIAARIGDGLSRNAVIGRLHRLGIKEGKVVKKRVLQSVRMFQQNAITERPLDKSVSILRVPGRPRTKITCTEADRSLASAPLGLSLMELASNSCRWPVNEPEAKAEYLFCGHPKRFGFYCAAHAAMSVGEGTRAEAMATRVNIAA